MKNLPESFGQVREQFAKLDAALCVPLTTKSGLVGIMTLGEKEGGEYAQADLEILDTLANHSALAIQNLRLQEHLRQSKELESFYKISSFVIHDLRNTASTLYMLSDNARDHMDDPDFRDNLVKSLAGSVEKMKELLSRVSMVSESKSLAPQAIDINRLIGKLVEQEIRLAASIELRLDLQPIPDVLADAEQLKKVLVNLLLNAIQAMSNGGKLSVRTKCFEEAGCDPVAALKKNGQEFVEVAVQDTGVGMTEEFLNTKLFKPFQTTKKKGLGIGLYHCKEMIEKLGGYIWARSKPGVGTTLYLALPVSRGPLIERRRPESGFSETHEPQNKPVDAINS